MIPQRDTERLLNEHLEGLGVAVERPVELVVLEDLGDAVRAELKHPDGRIETVRADWLLGCDGSHSTVRKQLGIEFTGQFEPNDWFLADVRVRGELSRDEISIFWQSRGILVAFPFGADRFRFVADIGHAPGTDHTASPTLEQAQAVLDERGPGRLVLHDPLWLSGFRIHERKVGQYRKGRCFLSGDAAHIHSPAGGQGMNTGMQDAYNLAWKVAMVHRGLAKPEILDSYSLEREAVGALVLKRASRLTHVATFRNPLLQFARNHIASWLLGLPSFREKVTSYLTELDIAYPNSPLNAEDVPSDWDGGIPPGDRLPDLTVQDARAGRPARLHEIIAGSAWNLLIFSGTPEAASELVAAMGSAYPEAVRAHPIRVDDVTRRRFGIRGDSAAILVRPDGIVAYRGQPAGDGAIRFLERWLISARPAAVPSS